MKADIKEDGYIHIYAESPAEGMALKYLAIENDVCSRCGFLKTNIVFHSKVNDYD